MSTVKKAAVAGTFYPDDPQELSQAVGSYAVFTGEGGVQPQAIIAPHAGYVYSGKVAGQAYQHVCNLRGRVDRVVIMGPPHRMRVRGVAISNASFFETPLGLVPQDPEALGKLRQLPFVAALDSAFEREHSIEVHLPFVQLALPGAAIVALLVGAVEPEQVAELLELIVNDRTLVVVSSDLTHFLSYEEAREIDQQTSRSIESLNFEAIEDDQACGAYPLRGLLLFARRRGWRADTVALASSGDTAGSIDSVVGYGAYIFTA